ncbi:MAG: TonB-dependent receptor [Gammaproteobacteria bacterium]|nr:TonB-dependent receptor [Gammaproteobacteria bacterium]
MQTQHTRLFLALSLALSLSPAAQAAEGLLSNGSVAVPAARIRIGKLVATSDEQGRFSLPELKAGNYRLEIQTARGEHYDIELHYDGVDPMSVDLARLGVDQMVVTASPLARNALSMANPATVLAGDELVRRREASLGETLSGQAGIQAGGFGAGASRPVIRGLDGARVRVLSDGVDVLDASTISPDHAASTEPLLAERIEVLKGPATLLYGGGAIGGVVNVVDEKVPTHAPEDHVEGAVELRGNSAAGERAGVFGITAGGSDLAFRLEGVKRDAGDYAIPGFAEAEPEPEEIAEGHAAKNRLPNSFNDTETATVGASWLLDGGYLGLAYTRQANQYGLPGHAEHEEGEAEEEHEAGAPFIDLEQDRWDLRGELADPYPGFSRLRLRLGHADYRHDEIEGSGELGTRFDNQATEGRVELSHEPLAGFRGTFGAQGLRRDFAATGEEAYVPPTLTRSQGLFLLEEYEAGDWRFEAGARAERQRIAVDTAGLPDYRGSGRSLSAGAVWKFLPGYSLNLNLASAQRLPSAEELYADGPHAATATFERGDAGLDAETARNLDVSVKKHEGDFTFGLNLFRNAVADYIYAADTGAEVDGLREIAYTQADARFRGMELETAYAFNESFRLAAFADRVRGELEHGGELPRMPADRVGLRAEAEWEAWSGRLEFSRVADQERTADFETETDGYDLLNLHLAYHGYLGDKEYQLFLKANNLLDEEMRSHASFIKDLVPQTGRNLTLGARLAF